MPHLTSSHYVAAMAVASLGLILIAVWKAYRLGRDRGVGVRAERFDRLYAEVDFDGTTWQVADTSRDPDGKIVGTVCLTQLGARLRAEGVDHANRRWSAEGVVFRRGLHLLFVERRERCHAVGSMNLTLDETGQRMTGMQSTWEGDQTGGAIQTVHWIRCPNSMSLAPVEGVASGEHRLATVAFRQQRTNVFRPVDTMASELVAAASSVIPPSFGPENR